MAVELRGGDKLERHLAALARTVANPASLKVGFLRGATYPDGTSVATVAGIHNFGAPDAGIPPRPFFTRVVKRGEKTWGAALGRFLVKNNMNVDNALFLMGELVKGEIQQEITSGNFKPLKPATVRRKGFSTPLVDTGHMLNSVDYEVTKK